MHSGSHGKAGGMKLKGGEIGDVYALTKDGVSTGCSHLSYASKVPTTIRHNGFQFG